MRVLVFIKSLLKSIVLVLLGSLIISGISSALHYDRLSKFTETHDVSFVAEQISKENIKYLIVSGDQYCFALKRPVSVNRLNGIDKDFPVDKITVSDKYRISEFSGIRISPFSPFPISASNYLVSYTSYTPMTLVSFLILNIVSNNVTRRIADLEEEMRRKRNKRMVTFDEIIGMEETKREVFDLIALYDDNNSMLLKIKKPKGVLFFGPPGNGKTMIAKAISNEIDGEFIGVSASEFMELYVGSGPKRIREIFAEAKQHEFCVIFIDEIDAIGSARSDRGGHSEAHNTLNQLLVEMDGIDTSSNILVIAATNMREGLDSALMRRFEIEVDFRNPTHEEIEELFVNEMRDVSANHIDYKYLASGLSGINRANVVSIVENAKRIACADNRSFVALSDIEEAAMRLSFGRKTDSIKLRSQELWSTCYHEAGHAFMSYYYYKKGVFMYPPRYLTVVPRAHALGFVQYPGSDYYETPSIASLTADMQVSFAGVLCEEIFLGDAARSIGCSSDLISVRDSAEKYVNFGLDREIGYVGIKSLNGRRHWTGSGTSATEENLKFNRVRLICEENRTEAMRILMENKNRIAEVAKAAFYLGYLSQEKLNAILEHGDTSDYLPKVVKENIYDLTY